MYLVFVELGNLPLEIPQELLANGGTITIQKRKVSITRETDGNINQGVSVPITQNNNTESTSSTNTSTTQNTNQTGSVPITRNNDTQSTSSTNTSTTHTANQTGSVPIRRSNDTQSTSYTNTNNTSSNTSNQQQLITSESRDLKVIIKKISFRQLFLVVF